ncbi:MAG: hypothetical protein Q9225_004477 [Loekoesia sp. 1 TL-2023]
MAGADDTADKDGGKAKSMDSKERRLLRVDQMYGNLLFCTNRPTDFPNVIAIANRQVHFVKTAKSKSTQERFKTTILVVRRIISRQGMVARTEIDIKSTLLRDILLDINKDVEGLELHKSPPRAQPNLMFHSLPGLESRRQQEERKAQPDATTIEHLSTAIQFVYEDFGSRIADLESLLEHRQITYELLWAIFPLRTLVFTKETLLEQPQIMRIIETEYHKGQDGIFFDMGCQIIAHDGEDFGTSYQEIRIPIFDGAREVEDLTAFPLSFHRKEGALRNELINRGKKYIKFLDPVCQAYDGTAAMEVEKSGKNTVQKFHCTGRAMTDPVIFKHHNYGTKLCTVVYKTNRNRTSLSEEDLLLCPATIPGFSFSAKIWAAFALSKLEPVVWNEKAFEKLVIGPKQRTLVHALVKAHGRGQSEHDDIIRDKGKGLIGLLSGSPGVGKTLTAEAVAEVTRRPLYMISAGELGKDLEAVDKRLDTVLTICRKWKCVLLLDEADVFLQARSKIDLERNALVSIFLRRLEYYQGILILTTNRIKSIDTAFQSRIHFSIQYPDLDTTSRRVIWSNFIRAHSEPSEITEDHISKLAEWDLNGRQIKNAVACASSLAWEESATLAMRHFDIVLEALAEFDNAMQA